MSGPFIGQIMIFAGNFAPSGYALCDGRRLSIADNPELFELIGTTYGGDGTTTFALPDLRGRVPVGQGQGAGLSTYFLGEILGTEQVGLTEAQLPRHSHQLNATAGLGTTNIPTGSSLLSSLGGQAGSGDFQVSGYYASSAGSQQQLNAVAIGQAGSGEPHSNIQPYLAINFCIALSGAIPQQG
jgi:microcystin-dependent protein